VSTPPGLPDSAVTRNGPPPPVTGNAPPWDPPPTPLGNPPAWCKFFTEIRPVTLSMLPWGISNEGGHPPPHALHEGGVGLLVEIWRSAVPGATVDVALVGGSGTGK
jgi:hypothetical protein